MRVKTTIIQFRSTIRPTRMRDGRRIFLPSSANGKGKRAGTREGDLGDPPSSSSSSSDEDGLYERVSTR
eukprot:21252-Pelagococcus_subviridis.AAC.1